jgi:signal transduction histidine kinase
VNQTLCDLLGQSEAELRKRTLLDVVDEGERHKLREFAEQREIHLHTAAGERRNVLLVMRRTGKQYFMHVVDLSHLAAAWEWRRTFDAVEMPILIVGGELGVARINRAARMLAGKSYGEIIGMSLRDFPAAEPWITIAALTSEVQESRGPAARQVKDSSARTLDLLAMLFNVDDADDDRVIVIVWDVSALVDLQIRLEQQRQMAAMGALVAGVAHEVRNPLFAISATIDAMEQTAGPELREFFEVLHEEIDRMTGLMQDLLAYGRPAAPVFTDLPVSQVIDVAVRACATAAMKQQVEIEVGAPVNLTVVADRDRLSRAVENVLMNAIQHSSPGSKITINTGSVREKKERLARIIVRDRGRGFTDGDLPRIFEPFFSRRKGGTGLGLALVHQIVTEHGGVVTAADAEGGGAEVVISIPARTSNATK